MNRNNTVAQAGGYIIQLMPGTQNEVINILEERLRNMDPVTTLLAQGHTPESMLEQILAGFDIRFSSEHIPVSFTCNCSRERMEKALISLGGREIDQMIKEQESIEMNCHFCNSSYQFSVDDLKKIRKA